jgi:hypothetical protein
LEPPFRPHDLFACKPDACKCLNEATGEVAVASLSGVRTGPLAAVNKISTACPGDQPAKSCSCTRGAPELTVVTPPFPNAVDALYNCLPDQCECADGSAVAIPPESLIRKIRSTCPEGSGPPLTCSSAAPGVPAERFPFNLRKILFEFQPVTCVCSEGAAPVPIVAFGCAAGGLPVCPQETPYRCSRGSLISLKAILHAQRHDECVCGEGAGVPVCFGSNEAAACPDGSKPADEAQLPSFIRKCAGRQK